MNRYVQAYLFTCVCVKKQLCMNKVYICFRLSVEVAVADRAISNVFNINVEKANVEK